MIGFFSLVEQKLGQRGRSTDWDAQNVATKICEAIDGSWPYTPPQAPPQVIRITDLTEAEDIEIIHEALKRGYAVMRLPEPKEQA